MVGITCCKWSIATLAGRYYIETEFSGSGPPPVVALVRIRAREWEAGVKEQNNSPGVRRSEVISDRICKGRKYLRTYLS